MEIKLYDVMFQVKKKISFIIIYKLFNENVIIDNIQQQRS
jgi:hypothetical protein